VSSNAGTKVTICGVEMTIAEAIETKSSIKHKKNLLAVLKSQFGTAVTNVEHINARVRKEIENKSTREGDKEKQQMSLEDFSKTYIGLHGVELHDPIKISQKNRTVGTVHYPVRPRGRLHSERKECYHIH